MSTLYMPLFKACKSIKALTQLHGRLIVTGHYTSPQASTKLIDSYAKMGHLKTSTIIFNSFPEPPDSFMWGVIIKNHVWNSQFREAIALYDSMVFEISKMSDYVSPSILRACSAIGDLGLGEKVHGRVLKSGFGSDSFVETSLLNMYSDLGCVGNAQKVFDEMSVRDSVSWSSVVSCYVNNGWPGEGLEVLRAMAEEGVEIDSVTLLAAAEACGELAVWGLAKSVHAYAVRTNVQNDDGTLINSLIAMYTKCGDVSSAEVIFRSASYRSTCTWTAMIWGFNQNAYYTEALGLFVEMLESNVEPNEVTLMSALCACARLGWLKEGKSIHAFLLRNDIDYSDHEIVRSALVDMYANCGALRDCYKVFDVARDKHVVSWNMLISGHAREGMQNEAMALFVRMLTEGVPPDAFTLGSVISSCGDIEFPQLGIQLHCLVVKTGYLENEFVQNSLIDMYSKSDFVDTAYQIFSRIEDKGVVAWTTMMCGLNRNGKPEETIALFSEMYSGCLEISEVTFLSVIQACSNTGCLKTGKSIHQKLIVFGVRDDLYVSTALIDMYAKCGDLQMARRVFDGMESKSVISWSTMISGFGMHGHVDAAISLFEEMINSGTSPNEVIFMNVLSACSHAGYVNEGKAYFNTMSDLGIEPEPEHYACLVDLLSRAGEVEEAYDVIGSVPFPVDASVWASLINGCRIHNRTDLIRRIHKKLENIQSGDSGYYMLLSNVYAERGEWGECRALRSKMQSEGLRKVHGYSAIQIDDQRIHALSL